jgi:hypothetical protein
VFPMATVGMRWQVINCNEGQIRRRNFSYRMLYMTHENCGTYH